MTKMITKTCIAKVAAIFIYRTNLLNVTSIEEKAMSQVKITSTDLYFFITKNNGNNLHCSRKGKMNPTNIRRRNTILYISLKVISFLHSLKKLTQ